MRLSNIVAWIVVFVFLGLGHGQAAAGSDSGPRAVFIDDVLDFKSVGSVSISPDGRWVAYVVTVRNAEKNINDSDLWVVPWVGGEPRRLTYHEGQDNNPMWFPDSSWLAFRSDRGGSTQMWGIAPDGGEAFQVSERKPAMLAARFSPDGTRLAFVAPEKKSEGQEKAEKIRGRPHVWGDAYDDQFARLWVAPLEDRRLGDAELTSPQGLHVTGLEWSPDSRRLAFSARPSPILRTYPETDVYLLDEIGAKPRKLTEMPGGESVVAWEEPVGLIVRGSGHELGTFNNQLWKVPISGGDPISLTADLDENAGFVALRPGALFVDAQFRTGRRLYRVDLQDGVATGAPVALTGGELYATGFSAAREGDVLAFLGEDSQRPPDVYAARLSDGAPRKLTEVNPWAAGLRLGAQSVVRWKSRADGEEIEGVLTLPVDYQDGQSVPLLLVIHGGPAGVSVDRFNLRRGAYPIQVFAGLGYAVLQPNYRGSTGYGERFRGLNRGDISGKDWIDIDSGVDEMVRRGIADPDRLGIMGWSFGGHHTFWGITQTDRYAAASAGAGANDLISMYSQTDIPQFYHTYLGPRPWEEFELYEQRSAYRFVNRVKTPLLIQVGEKDERVPAEQSIQFYEAVKGIGRVETELVIYPGQPHGVRDPRLVRDLLERNVAWFQRWIPVAVSSGR